MIIVRWIFYLLVLIGCTAFFAFYQGWVAWLLLNIVIWTPVLSLVMSLAPMLLTRPHLDFPGAVTAGDTELLTVNIHSPLPLPPVRCKFLVSHSFTGEKTRMLVDDILPLWHCGTVLCHCTRFYVYDYLGMFRLRLRRLQDKQILVRPKVIPMEPPRELEQFLARSWKPKYGGGFAEQHEMRLYRPGDSLNQVHWKLTAKTGKLIVREPMVPQLGRLLLTMNLSGRPAVLDRKLGQLQWMSQYLLELGLTHALHVHTGTGVLTLPVHNETELSKAIDTLLDQKPATTGTILDSDLSASWRYHIGGDEDAA